jgi:hypothetical protein
MDQQEISRRVAEANRLLVESRRSVDRQRDLIARLERIGGATSKQQYMLSVLLQEQVDREGRLAQLLRELEANPDPVPAAQRAGAKGGEAGARRIGGR